MSNENITFNLAPADLIECDRISDRIRGASDAAQVELIANDERAVVVAMLAKRESAPLGMAIKHLKSYTLWKLKKGRD